MSMVRRFIGSGSLPELRLSTHSSAEVCVFLLVGLVPMVTFLFIVQSPSILP